MRKGRSNFLYSFPGGFLSEDCRDTVVFSKSIDFLVTGSIQNWWLEFFDGCSTGSGTKFCDLFGIPRIIQIRIQD